MLAAVTAALPAQLEVEFAGLSETGPVRQRNEDHLGWSRLGHGRDAPFPDLGPVSAAEGARVSSCVGTCQEAPGTGLAFAIADGLGAYGGGDVASRLAVRALVQSVESEAARSARLPGLLRLSFDIANREVFDAALGGQGARRMQTTMSVLLLHPGEAHLGHVGDCRVYRLRGESLELLSTDHTQVQEMLRMRLITPEQAAVHPGRYALTRSLGGELIVRPDLRREALHDGDTFLMCSDGLWGKVDVGEIREAMSGELEQACTDLVARAVERGGEDNATLLTLRVHRAGLAPDRPQGWRRFFSA
ncbi:MAG: PP2C family protein-serine/threonine phosphatase [Candidatus Dormibacteria bacterium]